MDKKEDHLRKDVEDLKSWKQERIIALKVWMAFWGGATMTISSIGAVIAERWEDIKHFFQALKP